MWVDAHFVDLVRRRGLDHLKDLRDSKDRPSIFTLVDRYPKFARIVWMEQGKRDCWYFMSL